MDLVITNGTVITGDESTMLESAAVFIKDRRIAGVEEHWSGNVPEGAQVLDASGCLVIPGLINCHAHGVTPGPLFPSGAQRPSRERWLGNLDRHLKEATTTVLNLCGLASMDDVTEANKSHPVNVKTATCHTPSSLKAAEAVDGTGLNEQAKRLTVEEMLKAGAVAIGEIGAGHTLGGGGQDYMYIPLAIEEETGVRLEPREARRLKYAALGRHIRREEYDEAAMNQAIENAGLTGKLSLERAREIVAQCVLPPFQLALDGFREAAAFALQFGMPALFHNSAPSMERMLEVARDYATRGATLIACHTNHQTFEPEEGLATARELRTYHAIIECCTLDTFERKRLIDSRENWDVLLGSENVVDVIATDYAGGDWDPLLFGIRDIVQHGYAPLPVAIAMATSRVAKVIPALAPERGTIQPGKVADLAVIAGDNLADVRAVIINGRIVLREGKLVYKDEVSA